jgi:hypothetical protein
LDAVVNSACEPLRFLPQFLLKFAAEAMGQWQGC